MDQTDWLAERFDESRARLRAVAHRMLGSISEAEDAVQEAWLKVSRSDAVEVKNLGGWLTTVVARVCLDILRPATAIPTLTSCLLMRSAQRFCSFSTS